MGQFDDTLTLTRRQQAILKAAVEAFIADPQPVSSAALATHPDIRSSSATVRNEMAFLEEAGLLFQPHTSAGRIPTDRAYRCYVDAVIGDYQRRRRAPAPIPPQRDPGLLATCKLLGDLTRYAALAVVPGWQEHRLRHIELAPVGDDQLLVMLVTMDREVMHSLTTVSHRPGAARLRQLNNLLNTEFRGRLLSELSQEALARVVAALPHMADDFISHTPELVRRGLERDAAAPRVHVEGTAHLFEQLGSLDMPKLRALMAALHEESVFEQLFSRTKPGEIQVSIGAENPHPGLEECAIVFTAYRVAEGGTAGLGIVGPKRMAYRKIMRTIDAVVDNLNTRLEDAAPGKG